MKKKTAEQKFSEQLAKRWPNISVEQFIGMVRITPMLCKCGAEFVSTPKKVVKSGCPECASVERMLGKWKTVSLAVLKRLAKDRLDVKIVARHKTERLVKAVCRCGYKWTQNAVSLLVHLGGCPRCSATTCTVVGTKSIHSDRMPCISFTLNGSTHSISAHASRGKKLYHLVAREHIDFKKLLLAEKSATKAGKSLILGIVEGGKIRLVPDWKNKSLEQVDAWLRRRDLTKIRILSMDPGVENYAWSVLDVSRPFEVKVLASGMIKNTVREMTKGMHEQLCKFVDDVQSIMNEFDPEFLIAERYMSRGMGGTTIELVNAMIGAVALMWKKSSDRVKFIPAAEWKNRWNSKSSLDEFYQKVNCAVHQVDSIGIGIYGAAYWLDERPFETIKKLEKILPRQINATDRK